MHTFKRVLSKSIKLKTTFVMYRFMVYLMMEVIREHPKCTPPQVELGNYKCFISWFSYTYSK